MTRGSALPAVPPCAAADPYSVSQCPPPVNSLPNARQNKVPPFGGHPSIGWWPPGHRRYVSVTVGSTSVTSRRTRWRVALATTVLLSFVFVHLAPCGTSHVHHHHDTAAQTAVFVADTETAPVSSRDGDTPHHHHTCHGAGDTCCAATRTMNGFAWLTMLLAAAAALIIMAADHVATGSRERRMDRDLGCTGRLVLLQFCITRI